MNANYKEIANFGPSEPTGYNGPKLAELISPVQITLPEIVAFVSIGGWYGNVYGNAYTAATFEVIYGDTVIAYGGTGPAQWSVSHMRYVLPRALGFGMSIYRPEFAKEHGVTCWGDRPTEPSHYLQGVRFVFHDMEVSRKRDLSRVWGTPVNLWSV